MQNKNNSKEQKLIDICFSLVACAIDYSDYWEGKSIEEKMLWVSNQLKICGFETIPAGSSWGILKDDYNVNNK
jgi:hypothetical protein